MSIKTEVQAIKTIEDTVVNNKVAKFAYTDEAYRDNDADGVEEYDVTQAQNIPVSDPSILKVNAIVLTKGWRSQASSITRMLMNHFLGRCSYNLNKIHDLFSNLINNLVTYIGAPNGLATLDNNGWLTEGQLPRELKFGSSLISAYGNVYTGLHENVAQDPRYVPVENTLVIAGNEQSGYQDYIVGHVDSKGYTVFNVEEYTQSDPLSIANVVLSMRGQFGDSPMGVYPIVTADTVIISGSLNNRTDDVKALNCGMVEAWDIIQYEDIENLANIPVTDPVYIIIINTDDYKVYELTSSSLTDVTATKTTLEQNDYFVPYKAVCKYRNYQYLSKLSQFTTSPSLTSYVHEWNEDAQSLDPNDYMFTYWQGN